MRQREDDEVTSLGPIPDLHNIMLLDNTPPANNKKRSAKTKKKDLAPFNLPKEDDKENNPNAQNVAPGAQEQTGKPLPAADAAPAVSADVASIVTATTSSTTEPALEAASTVAPHEEPQEETPDQSELRKRREEIERLQAEKRELEELMNFNQARLRKKEQETKTERVEKERLQGEVATLNATILKLKSRIDELERDLAKTAEEKAIEEEKSRHLAKLHAEQAHQHAAVLAEELKLHEKQVGEERAKMRRLEVQLQESHEVNAALTHEIEEAHIEMREMKQSQEATQQLATLTAIKDAFALQIEVQKKENETLLSQVDHLQRELFFTLALALKLNHSLAGRPSNKDVHDLWDQARQDGLKPEQFSRWLSIQMSEVKQSEH